MNTTDTRYQKLQGMIDAGKKNLGSVLTDIMRENEQREDLLVNPQVITYDVDKTVHPVLQLPQSGLTKRFNLTPFSTRQLYGRAGIPQRFAENLIDLGEKDLLAENIKKVSLHTAKDGVLIRHIDEQIKGWLSPSYKRMDSGPIIEAFVEHATKRGFVPIMGRNTDYRYQIRFVIPEVMQVSANEFVVYGISLVTGDYGNQALEINILMIRLMCTNLHEGYDMFRRVHLGSRVDMGGEESILLSKQTRELDAKTLASAIGDVTAQFGDHVTELQKQLTNAIETEIVNPETHYHQLKAKGLKKGIVDAVKAVYESNMGIEVLPQEKNKWRFSNALSFVSQSQASEDDKIDLEKLAMSFLAN